MEFCARRGGEKRNKNERKRIGQEGLRVNPGAFPA
jgi:hypothetical protein